MIVGIFTSYGNGKRNVTVITGHANSNMNYCEIKYK